MFKGGHEDRRTGKQVIRKTKGPENRTGGTIHWLIDVNVLYPAVIVLQLIYSAVNVPD